MFLLSPAKLLVVLVVALMVLGPDKLPKVAKQLGSLWGDFRKFREHLESEVRDTFPDLPSTDTITHAVRSPLTFLNSLTEDHDENGASATSGSDGVPSRRTDEAIESTGPTVLTRESDGIATNPVIAEEVSTIGQVNRLPPVGVVHRVDSAQYLGVSDSELN